MKTHSNFASRFFGIITIGAVGWLQPTAVSGQTAEGTDIVNIANVSYDDANGNNYASGPASVTVTVGFVAGVDVQAAAPTATPAVNTTGNTMSFDVTNMGNGVDTMTVGHTISDAFLTVTQFTFNSLNYADIAALNVALQLYEFVAASTMTITVEYSIADNTGGELSTYTLTATSDRDTGVNDSDFTDVTPALTGAVTVTPDGSQSLTHLNSNGTNYTFTFRVTNSQTGADDFNLLATNTGSVITIVRVNGVLADNTTITLAAGANADIDVEYSVAGSALDTDNLYLAATSVADSDTNDQGFADMTVIEANLSIVKEAWLGDKSLEISEDVLPLDFIEYKVIVTNDGTVTVSNVVVADDLPATLTYISVSDDVGTWTVGGSGNNRTFTLTTSLAPAASGSFFIRVQVN